MLQLYVHQDNLKSYRTSMCIINRLNSLDQAPLKPLDHRDNSRAAPRNRLDLVFQASLEEILCLRDVSCATLG